MKYCLFAMTLFSVIILPAYAENNREDYDLDDDGLIEINDLQDLNEIRNNANGASLYQSSIGCELGQPRPYCAGFELTADLDFDSNQNGIFDEGDAYWNGGEGWEPLPLFMASFNGNGYTIRNLTINRPTQDYQGLFGYIFGYIRNLYLINVSIRAASTVGGVAGFLDVDSSISDVFVTGEIHVSNSSNNSSSESSFSSESSASSKASCTSKASSTSSSSSSKKHKPKKRKPQKHDHKKHHPKHE